MILWGLCALSVYFSCVTDLYFWCVAGVVIFFVFALWRSVVLIKCRQKLVVDAEGIHYAEQKRRKLVWRHYYWKDVKCCYFDYEIRHSLYGSSANLLDGAVVQCEQPKFEIFIIPESVCVSFKYLYLVVDALDLGRREAAVVPCEYSRPA